MKKVKWILIGLLILAVLAVIYFKMIKPSMDRKREAQRKRETDIITAAQPPPPVITAPPNPASSSSAPAPTVGIGGTAVDYMPSGPGQYTETGYTVAAYSDASPVNTGLSGASGTTTSSGAL